MDQRAEMGGVVKFVAGIFVGAIITGAAIAVAQPPSQTDLFTDITGPGFMLAGGHVGVFDSIGRLLPLDPKPAGTGVMISMTPGGEVACADLEAQRLLRRLADRLGVIQWP